MLRTHYIRISLLAFALTAAGCTEQLSNSFRLAQQEETFSSMTNVNTKLDMLWVVDNSPSMAPSQKKLRDGFRAFADRYMKPTWDIRVAVISQDTFLAHPSFRDHLNGVDNGWFSRPAGYQSTYLNPASGANPRRTTPFVTPAYWTAAGSGISANGTVTGNGALVRLVQPDYGGANLNAPVSAGNPSQWARLLPGRHDGPLTTMCWTTSSNAFFYGAPNCPVRDQQNIYSGTSGCVNGGVGVNDSAAQCVNTLMNNTVRSGKPIISTLPPSGTPADAAWTQQLYADFAVNLSGGVSGLGIEKFFNSMQQLIADNESTSTKFFRPDALRVIVIATDEDDQSMVFPAGQIAPTSFGYDSGASCPWKTVDGHTYRLQICPRLADSLPVATFKTQLDDFFRVLDGKAPGQGDPNYFVVTISPKTGDVIQDLHDAAGEDSGGYNSVSVDRADRLFAFADSVGNGSLKLELTSADYSPLLDAIGLVIVSKKAVFTLTRAPTTVEEMIVWVLHADGSRTVIQPSQFTVVGNVLTITDEDFLLTLTSTDRILVNYQPRSVE